MAIDAALYSRSKCYFFKGNQYIRVTRGDTGAGTVDPGYPAPISNWGWPAGFGASGIDAALYSRSKCYFFKGNQYIRVTRGDTGAGTVDPGYPAPISNWGWPAGFGASGIDAALYSRSKCYFFKGNQYIRVTRGDTGAGTVDPGYPAPISNWGWPVGFGASGIDAALYSRSKCYFFKGNRYIRVTRGDTGAGTVDPGYPAPISNWGWPAATVVDTSYIPDLDPDLPNPERGMYYGAPPSGADSHTIVAIWLWLAPVCNVDLIWNGHNQAGTSPVLNVYASKLEGARAGGYKVLFRPCYDKEVGGGPSSCTVNGAKVFHADNKVRQKQHIDAIAAMLGDYKDVIAYIQAGYLGNWGEWNTAGGYGPENAPLLHNYPDRSEIIDHVLSAYGAQGIAQDVELRRPVFAKEVLVRNPSANVGLHNDCFMTNDSDTGTYSDFPGSPQNFGDTSQAKEWAVELTKSSSFGGETCPSGGNERWRSCSNMTNASGDPATLHLNYLNGDWAADAVSTWTAGGCFDEVRRRLGYRFEVTRVEYTPTVGTGQTFQIRVDVKNTGWAKLHKPRQARIVLRKGSTRHVYSASSGAVSSWAPTQTTTIAVNEPAPSAGTYSVRLWIPDPDAPNSIPYVVKLATSRSGVNIYDATTGENDLGVSITVQ